MLVLQRKHGESIIITPGNLEPITVMVVEIRNKHQVRLGVSAPQETAINREEVHKAIVKADAEAGRKQAPLIHKFRHKRDDGEGAD